ncbi:19433_t:CDS:2 [Gigaspora margarita]|uniref:19433_t:CDS:1 n=1 Tax=Gigaspora margarita TaxID=4874 RepID=A0ABN7W1E4_GIGMA|nr:19433_t:CDS:2 [Gigaspora margarita]
MGDSLTQLYNKAINRHYQAYTNNRALAIQVLQSIEPDLFCIFPETIIDIDSTSSPLESDSLNTKISQTILLFLQLFFNICSTPPNISLLTSTANYWFSVAINRDIEQTSSSSYTLLYLQLDTSNNFSSKISPIPISTQNIALLSSLTSLNNQSDSDSEQSFGKAFTAILDQVRNNNTNNQDLSSNHPTSDEESNSSDSKTEINNVAIALN